MDEQRESPQQSSSSPSLDHPRLKGIDASYIPPSYGGEDKVTRILDTLNSGQEEDDTNLGRALRFLHGKEISSRQSADQLGIFEHSDRGSQARLGYFFTHMLEGVLSLERGIIQGAHSFGSYQEERAKGTVIKRENQDSSAFARLAAFLSNVLYLPENEYEKSVSLYHLGITHENGRPRRSPVANYISSSKVILHQPHNPVLDKKTFQSAIPYDFKIPAEVSFLLTDTQYGYRLVFEFFPLPHRHYEGASQLEGASAKAASGLLRTHVVRRKDLSEITSTIEEAKASEEEPYFQLRLEAPNGEEITAVEGNVVKKLVREEIREKGGSRWIEEERYGLSLYPLDFPNITVFVPLPRQTSFSNEEQKVLNKNIPLKGIIDDFKGLGLKSDRPIQKGAKEARVRSKVAV